MSDWIRAEDAPDKIAHGALALKQHLHDKSPEFVLYDSTYDRRTRACGGYFFREYDLEGPVMDHDLPDREHHLLEA